MNLSHRGLRLNFLLICGHPSIAMVAISEGPYININVFLRNNQFWVWADMGYPDHVSMVAYVHPTRCWVGSLSVRLRLMMFLQQSLPLVCTGTPRRGWNNTPGLRYPLTLILSAFRKKWCPISENILEIMNDLNFEGNMNKCVISTVPADGLAPLGHLHPWWWLSSGPQNIGLATFRY